MLKFHQLFFVNLFIILAATVFVSGVATYFALQTIEQNAIEKELRRAVQQFEIFTAGHLREEIQEKSIAFEHETGIRVTLIDGNGEVYIESSRDPEGIENHGSRPEILQAKDSGYGVNIRTSATVGRPLMYLAKKSGNLFIRMAVPSNRIEEQLLPLWTQMLLLFIASILVGMGVSYLINKRIHRELGQLLETVEEIADKRYFGVGIFRFKILEFDLLKGRNRSGNSRRRSASKAASRMKCSLLSVMSFAILSQSLTATAIR